MKSIPSVITFPTILIAGIVGQKLAAKLWQQIFDEEPPDTAQQDAPMVRLFFAAVIEGTMYKLLRMAADRGMRKAVLGVSGTWPGELGDGE